MVLVAMLDELGSDLEAAADPGRAPAMAAYMKHRFDFLGVRAPDRRRVSRSVIVAARTAPAAELIELADACWSRDHREFQYVATDVLRAGVAQRAEVDIVHVRRYVVTRSWWDTVDALAAGVVGPLVARHPRLRSVMDEWIDDEVIWLVRAAILHQLGYGEDTDAARLFAYCDRRATDGEFFIRKALGWALRQYGRVRPAEVTAYVEANDHLSALTRREALKHRR